MASLSSPSGNIHVKKESSKKQEGVFWNDTLFSSSVNTVLNAIQELRTADLFVLLKHYEEIHPDYGIKDKTGVGPIQELLSFLKENLPTGTSRSAIYWAENATAIFLPPESSMITGRLFIIASLLAESEYILSELTGEHINKCPSLMRSVINILEAELHSLYDIDVKKHLTKRGHELWSELMPGRTTLYETANITDGPAADDYLSRKALAGYLANRLNYIYEHDISGSTNSFFMQIDGAWGSGKSTLLGFLKKFLQRDLSEDNQRRSVSNKLSWMVIEFNAWQNQRLDPPWWFLMKAVHKGVLQMLWRRGYYMKWCKTHVLEFFWRLNVGTNKIVALLVTAGLFGLATWYGIKSQGEAEKLPIIQLVALAGFLWSLTTSIRTSLVSGSAKAAQIFMQENGKDPMTALAEHFERQVKRAGAPLAIFIDDLDRCNKDYGIKLLEGLQTIFRNAGVVYVVAADRRWLSVMYENHYSVFAPAISKPAKPFGLTFLDKTFQLIVELPSISNLHKQAYWNHLLNVSQGNVKKPDEIRKEAKEKVKQAYNNTARLQTADNTGGTELEKQIYREEAVNQLSIREEEAALEHRLQKFLDLIEPNPRAMKRIINDVSTARTIAYLYNQQVDEDQLILWTILKLEHPALAEFFWENPEKLECINDKGEEAITGNKEFDELLKNGRNRKLFCYEVEQGNAEINARFIQQMRFEDLKPVD